MEKTQSSVPGFLTKLWTLVDDENTDEIIRWSESGKSFQILDGGRLAKELLPLYFKHSNLASFIRQLNMYGFHKVLNGSMMDRSAYSDDMEFAHNFFLRGRPELLERIKRKVTYGRSGILEPVSFPRAASPMHPSQAARGQSSGQASGDSKWGVVVAADSPQRQPIRDLPRLVQQIATLQAKQNAMNARLTSVKQENEALWRELHSLRTKHDKQQHVVNKIVQFLVSLAGQSSTSSRRFLPGIKRTMGGSTFGGPAAITLNNRPASNTNSFPGDVKSEIGVGLRSTSALAQPNVAAAAIDLMNAANTLLGGDTSGAQQTVFVEEIEDDADINDFRSGTITDAPQVWSPLSAASGNDRGRDVKRRRIMTSSGDEASESAYEELQYEGAYAGDPYNVNSAGVQISELDTVWPAVANVASTSASTSTAASRNIAVDPSAAVPASTITSNPSTPRVSLASAPGTERIDLNSLFESIVDPQTQAQITWPVQSPTPSNGASSVDMKLRLDTGLKSPVASNASVVDDSAVGLPVLSNQGSARDDLHENLDSIQMQLDGLRAFLANEQYASDDNMLMELFNADSDVVPRANIHEVGSTNSGHFAGSRHTSDVIGHELVEYTDPANMQLFDFFSEPGGGEASFPVTSTAKSADDAKQANDSASATSSKKVTSTSSTKPMVTVLKPPIAADLLNTPDVSDDTPKRPFIVKTFTPASNISTSASANAAQSRQSITPTAKRS